MSDIQSTEFLRLLKVITDVSQDVVRFYTKWKFMESKCKTLDGFLDFNKHMFYHKYTRTPFQKCCHCAAFKEIKSSKNEMQKWIFDKLYETHTGITCSVGQTNGTKIDFCLCCVRVKTDVSLDDLDISVISFLLRHTDMTNSYVEDINDQRGLVFHACSTTCFTKEQSDRMWNILEQSTLALAQHIDRSYCNTVKRNIKMLKKCEIGKEELDDLLNSIKQIDEHAEELMDMISNSLSSITKTVTEEAKEIKTKIAEGTSSVIEVQTKLEKNTEKLRKEVSRGIQHSSQQTERLISAANTVTSAIGEKVSNGTKSVSNKIDTCCKDISQITKEVAEEVKKDVVGSIRQEFNEFKSEIKMLLIGTPKDGYDSPEAKEDRKIDMVSTVTSDYWNEERALQNLTSTSEVEPNTNDDPRNIYIQSVENRCIQLELSAHPDVFKSPEKLHSALRNLTLRLLKAGEVDTNKAGTIKIEITVKTPLTEEENKVVYEVFTQSSSPIRNTIAEVKLKQPTIYSTSRKEDISQDETESELQKREMYKEQLSDFLNEEFEQLYKRMLVFIDKMNLGEEKEPISGITQDTEAKSTKSVTFTSDDENEGREKDISLHKSSADEINMTDPSLNESVESDSAEKVNQKQADVGTDIENANSDVEKDEIFQEQKMEGENEEQTGNFKLPPEFLQRCPSHITVRRLLHQEFQKEVEKLNSLLSKSSTLDDVLEDMGETSSLAKNDNRDVDNFSEDEFYDASDSLNFLPF